MPRGVILVVISLMLKFVSLTEATEHESLAVTPPGHTVTTPRGTAAFLCSPTRGSVSSVQWMINDTRLELLNLPGVSHEFRQGRYGNYGSLMLRRIPVTWNNTVIHCTAVFTGSGSTLTSNNCTLQLQGLLQAVGSLEIVTLGTSATLNWTAPFTLPFAIIPPYITYCVDVHNTHDLLPNLPPVLIHSQCGVEDTSYTFVPMFTLSECDSLEFTVTPVNLAGNGTSASIGASAYDPSVIAEVGLPPVLTEGDFNVSVTADGTLFNFTLNSSTLLYICEANLTLEDHTQLHLNSSNGLLCDRTPEGHTSLTFSVSLPHNQIIQATFSTTNCAGSTVSRLQLSTHDLQSMSLEPCPSSTNCLDIHPTFISGSIAQGALLLLSPSGQDQGLIEESGEEETVFLAVKREGSTGFQLQLDGGGVGVYQVRGYDVEWDGIVRSRRPAVRGVASVTHDINSVSTTREEPLANIQSCNATSHDTSISVYCSNSAASADSADSVTGVSGFTSVIQDTKNMEDLMIGQVVGTSELAFHKLEAGNYMVAVLPELSYLFELTSNSSSAANVVVSRPLLSQVVTVSSKIISEGIEKCQNNNTLSMTMIITYCVISFVVGVVSACLPLSLLLLCLRHKKRGRVMGRTLGREGIENSLYSECKMAVSPVYEDISSHFVNKTHFECEENQAYGHAANCHT